MHISIQAMVTVCISLISKLVTFTEYVLNDYNFKPIIPKYHILPALQTQYGTLWFNLKIWISYTMHFLQLFKVLILI